MNEIKETFGYPSIDGHSLSSVKKINLGKIHHSINIRCSEHVLDNLHLENRVLSEANSFEIVQYIFKLENGTHQMRSYFIIIREPNFQTAFLPLL